MAKTRSSSGKGEGSEKEDDSKKDDASGKKLTPKKRGQIPKKSTRSSRTVAAPPQEDGIPSPRQTSGGGTLRPLGQMPSPIPPTSAFHTSQGMPSSLAPPPSTQMLPPPRPTSSFNTTQSVIPRSGPPAGIHPSTMGIYNPQPLSRVPDDDRPRLIPRSVRQRSLPSNFEASRGLRAIKSGASGARRPADQLAPIRGPLSTAGRDTAVTKQQIAHDRKVAENLERAEKARREIDDRIAAEALAREEGEPMDGDPYGAAQTIKDGHAAEVARANATYQSNSVETPQEQDDDFVPDAQASGWMRPMQEFPPMAAPNGPMPTDSGTLMEPPLGHIFPANDRQAMQGWSCPGLHAPLNAYEMPSEQALMQALSTIALGGSQAPPLRLRSTLPPNWPPSPPNLTPLTYNPLSSALRPPPYPCQTTSPPHGWQPPRTFPTLPARLQPSFQIPPPPPYQYNAPLGRYHTLGPIQQNPIQMGIDRLVPGHRQVDARIILDTQYSLRQSVRIMTHHNGRIWRPAGAENALEEAIRYLGEFLANLEWRAEVGDGHENGGAERNEDGN